MKSNKSRIALSVVTSLIVSISTLAVINHKSDNNHNELTEGIKADFSSKKASFERLSSMQNDIDRLEYADDISNMVYKLNYFPDNVGRTKLINDIIKVIEDDVISDDEYSALQTGFKTLNKMNKISKIQETAAKFLD